MGKEICQLRLGQGEVPGPLSPHPDWLCKVAYVESCSCAWNSRVCRVTPMISKAMSSSICRGGQGGREGCLGPHRGDALGRGLRTMLDWFSGLFIAPLRSWGRVLHLPAHLLFYLPSHISASPFLFSVSDNSAPLELHDFKSVVKTP